MFPELVDYNGTHSPDHAVFRYEDPDDNDVRTIYWSDSVVAFHIVDRYFKKYIHDDSVIMMGILANADTLTFYATIVGIMRIGYIPFLISVRNSAPAVAHLMKSTNAKYLVVSGDPSVQTIADLVCNQYDGNNIATIPMPTFSDIYSCDLKPHELLPPFTQSEWTQTALIMYSSGTTGFPNPISLTHEFLLQLMKAPYYGEVDLCGEVFSVQAWPMYPTIGFWITSFRVPSLHISINNSPPRLAPTVIYAVVLLIIMVKLFEDNGDVFLQVVILDHCPALLVYSANQAGNPDPRIPENMDALFEKGTETIAEMMSRDGNFHPLLRSLRKLNDA
ncbi:hypothetical protein IW261DRAFT_1677495 [Armillaria novae-zelandiae]|uniref:AMP-dependent synthetase/ligase domain-containing protein n=1 Tax=Armillaria novae-zelandiae TaxID=153914 RepID=A0AA39NN46_9AGAR|nr:hypothetical protein IW261DRAFT_1677495 [Armillaria novae-zelandiae]